MIVLSIDPGTLESAYVLMTGTYEILGFGKVENNEMLKVIRKHDTVEHFVIESMTSYGMAVGASIFTSCIWIGRFVQCAIDWYNPKFVEYIYRPEVKLNICKSVRAKDSNIRRALLDRYGEVGTKKNKGVLYGFKSDIFSALAVGTTYLDKLKNDEL